jgi:RNA polymerase subunit RPABC4/transcription elongation factor Spt4
MFGVVSRYIVATRHPFRKRVSWCIQSTSFCHRNHFFVFRNKHAQSTTLGPKLMFGVVSRNFVDARHPFRKRVSGCIQSMSFRNWNHFFVFATNMPNPLVWVQNSCLVWFRAISLSYVTHSQNGCRGAYKARLLPPEPFLRFSQQSCPIHYFRSKTHVWCGFALFRCRTSPIPKTSVGVHTKHEFLPPEPFLRFSQRTCPIHYFRSKTHVWVGFAQFRCRTSPIPETGVRVDTKHEFSPPEPFLRFSQRTCPIHYFRSQTHVWGGFVQFGCRTSPIPKTDVRVHTQHEFSPPEPFLRFRNEHAESTSLGPKLMFGVVSHYFVAARHPFQKRVSGCIQSTSFCHRNHFFVFRNNHAQSTTLGPKLMFGVISRYFVAARHPFRKRVSGCIQSTSFCHRNHFFVFCNEHAQSTTLGPKLMFGLASRNFVAARHPFRKRVSRYIQSTSFRHRNHFFVFHNEHAQSTTLGRKLMFGVVSRNFVAARHPFRKRVSGAYKARVFATGTISSFFATDMPNPLL